MILLVTVAAVVLFLAAARFVSAFGRAVHTELRVPLSAVVAPEAVPPAFREALLAAGDALERRGFRTSHFERRVDAARVVDLPCWIALYHHDGERAWAEVTAARAPTRDAPVAFTFVTLHADHRTMTVGADDAVLGERVAGTRTIASPKRGVHAQWCAHRRAVERVEAERSPGARESTTAPDVIARRHDDDASAWHAALRANGTFVPGRDGSRLHWKTALSLVTGRTGTRRPADAAPSSDPSDTPPGELSNTRPSAAAASPGPEGRSDTVPVPDILPLETDAFERRRRLERDVRISPRFRFATLLLSALACSAFLTWLLSFQFVLFLVPVLLLHELGHLAAMAAFGYENRYVVFTPLGALASGERDDAGPWREALVLLAGPLPGLLLGLALLVALPEVGPTAFALIATLIGLNVANLLPIVPLDGGRLVELALPARRPLPRLLLSLAGLLLAASGAVLLGDPFLAVLAVSIVFGIAQERGTQRLLRDLGNPGPDERGDAAERLLGAMIERRWSFEEKFQRTRDALSLLQRRSLGAPGAAALLAVYGACLVGPMLLLGSDTANARTRLVESGTRWLIATLSP